MTATRNKRVHVVCEVAANHSAGIGVWAWSTSCGVIVYCYSYVFRLTVAINGNLFFALISPIDSLSSSSGTSSIGSIDSPLSSSITPHSFIPGLKPSFSAKPSHLSLPFLLPDRFHGFHGLFSDNSEHIPFYYFLVFLFSTF